MNNEYARTPSQIKKKNNLKIKLKVKKNFSYVGVKKNRRVSGCV